MGKGVWSKVRCDERSGELVSVGSLLVQSKSGESAGVWPALCAGVVCEPPVSFPLIHLIPLLHRRCLIVVLCC